MKLITVHSNKDCMDFGLSLYTYLQGQSIDCKIIMRIIQTKLQDYENRKPKQKKI